MEQVAKDKVNGDYTFFMCHNCQGGGFYSINQDPTSNTGCCIRCGDDNWTLYLTNVTHKDVFAAKLKGEQVLVSTPDNYHADAKFKTIEVIA